jgi:adenine-specific DNA-methyltransferase
VETKMQNLLNDVKAALEQDDRLLIEGKLLKNKIVELALAMDSSLLKLLLATDSIKRHFFANVDGIYVFDKIKFQRFIGNKTFLPDSYTAFKNKIGLTVNGNYLSENQEVVLAWPYKDCVLEGGQSKEDAKRDEIFWNETLGPDQIDKLLAPKVLTNIKRYNENGVETPTSIGLDDNFIIKGNNLLALHTLKGTHLGKVKLIYIDPPYNTGNDEFKYNDNFNHSTWLTFSRNRLQIAKTLLANDGAIFVSIDHNELAYTLVLLDEIFGKDNFQNLITIKRGSVTGHKTINSGVVNLAEYVVIYTKNKKSWKPNRLFIERERNDRYNNYILNRDQDISKWEFCSLLDAFAESINLKKSQLKKQLGDDFEKHIFDFIVKNSEAVIQFAYPDETKVSEEARALIKKSKSEPDQVFYLARSNEPDIYLINGQRILFYSDRLIEVDGKMVTGELLSDIWLDVLPNDLHNEGGVKLKKGKKPEKLLQRLFELGTNPNDIILDFYLGSGTTCAVAHKLNRKYIGIEQLDYIDDKVVTRMINVLQGDSSGISKTVNWKGGGSFVYCELAMANQKFVEIIQNATNHDELVKIWSDMQESAFLSYKIDSRNIPIASDDFVELAFEDKQRFLIEVLDKNMLYVPLSEIDDETYGITNEEKILNRQFHRK